MADDLQQLMLADITPDGPLLAANGPLASAAGWADAVSRAGRTLGTAAHAGTLQRGPRDILSYQMIFHWNRLGLPARTQSILAGAATPKAPTARLTGSTTPPTTVAALRFTARPYPSTDSPPPTATGPR